MFQYRPMKPRKLAKPKVPNVETIVPPGVHDGGLIGGARKLDAMRKPNSRFPKNPVKAMRPQRVRKVRGF